MDVSGGSDLRRDTSRKLARLGLLTPAQLESLGRNNVSTTRELLTASQKVLIDALHVGPDELNTILRKASEAVTAKPATAWQLLQLRASVNDVRLRPAEPPADDWLRAQAGMLTEVCGPSGAGKTQFALLWAVRALVAHAATQGSVVFIDTENAFDATRAVQFLKMALRQESKANPFNQTSSSSSLSKQQQQQQQQLLAQLTGRLRSLRADSCARLLERVVQLEELVIEHSVKCIIVDCITSPVTNQYDSTEMPQRQDMLNQVAIKLKLLAHQFNIPVVITNQTRTRSYETKAALGTLWSHAVNTRMMLAQQQQQFGSSATPAHTIELIKSPAFDTRGPHIPYTITKNGVEIGT
jgi:RecA/RadA recombinase